MNDIAQAFVSIGPVSRGGDSQPVLELRDATCRVDRSSRRLAPAARRDSPGDAVAVLDTGTLTLARGEALGIVGRSGAGKSVLARLAAGLLPLTTGELRWCGRALGSLPAPEQRIARRKLQLVCGDPRHTLDPRRRILQILSEAPVAHRLITREQATEYVGLVLNQVGLDPMSMRRFPHAFSPGERVRIGIARALAMKPDVLVCDDPFVDLDPTEGAHVMNVLLDLRGRSDVALLVLSRAREAVAHLCDRRLTLEGGRIAGGPATTGQAT